MPTTVAELLEYWRADFGIELSDVSTEAELGALTLRDNTALSASPNLHMGVKAAWRRQRPGGSAGGSGSGPAAAPALPPRAAPTAAAMPLPTRTTSDFGTGAADAVRPTAEAVRAWLGENPSVVAKLLRGRSTAFDDAREDAFSVNDVARVVAMLDVRIPDRAAVTFTHSAATAEQRSAFLFSDSSGAASASWFGGSASATAAFSSSSASSAGQATFHFLYVQRLLGASVGIDHEALLKAGAISLSPKFRDGLDGCCSAGDPATVAERALELCDEFGSFVAGVVDLGVAAYVEESKTVRQSDSEVESREAWSGAVEAKFAGFGASASTATQSGGKRSRQEKSEVCHALVNFIGVAPPDQNRPWQQQAHSKTPGAWARVCSSRLQCVLRLARVAGAAIMNPFWTLAESAAGPVLRVGPRQCMRRQLILQALQSQGLGASTQETGRMWAALGRDLQSTHFAPALQVPESGVELTVEECDRRALQCHAGSAVAPLRVLLLGQAGTGKSQLVRQLTGREDVVSGNSAAGVTTKIRHYSADLGHGLKAEVYDTPGLGHAGLSLVDVVQQLRAISGTRFDVVVVTCRVTDVRATLELQCVETLLPALLEPHPGRTVGEHVMLCGTHADVAQAVGGDVLRTLDTFTQQQPGSVSFTFKQAPQLSATSVVTSPPPDALRQALCSFVRRREMPVSLRAISAADVARLLKPIVGDMKINAPKK